MTGTDAYYNLMLVLLQALALVLLYCIYIKAILSVGPPPLFLPYICLAAAVCVLSGYVCLQHNALRAICPATASIVMAVLKPSSPAQLRHTALQCFVLMVRVLLRSSPDQVCSLSQLFFPLEKLRKKSMFSKQRILHIS